MMDTLYSSESAQSGIGGNCVASEYAVFIGRIEDFIGRIEDSIGRIEDSIAREPFGSLEPVNYYINNYI